jgi:hypothetical protein
MSIGLRLLDEAKYRVSIDLPQVLPFHTKMHSILLKEYGLANEKVPPEGSAHHRKDGISFACRVEGAGMDNPGVCTIIGPLSKKDKIERYVKEAVDEYPNELGIPELERSAYSKIEL